MATNRFNHNELLYLIHQNDEEAFDLLYTQSLPLIYTAYKKCSWLIDLDDWKSEAMICLERAINRYREDLQVDFNSLFMTFLRNRISEIQRASRAQKAIPLYATYPYEILDEEGKFLSVEETGLYTPTNQEEHDLITKITCDQVLNQLSSHLDAIELKILDLLRQGYSQVLIAKILDINSNKVRRTRAKAIHIYESLKTKRKLL